MGAMPRFEDILEKVESYNPKVDEELLRKRLRRLGTRPPQPAPLVGGAVPRPPAERGDDPRGDEARRGLDRDGPPARRPRGHRDDEGTARRSCSGRTSRTSWTASRRSAGTPSPLGRLAGRDLPQDAPRDDGRPQGHPRQARGPPPQHEDARAPLGREAPGDRGRDDGDLRAAREPARHGQGEGRARGPVVPVPLPGRVGHAECGRRRAAEGLVGERREDPARAPREDRTRRASRPR